MNAADTLRQLRRAAGLTQQQLANKAGLDRSWVNQMERGNRPITRTPREKLAGALGVSPIELGGGQEEAPAEFQSLHARLEALEVAVDDDRRRRERALRAVTRRLALLEAALETRERRGGRPQSGRG